MAASLCHMSLDRVRKYKLCSFSRNVVEHNEYGVRLTDQTLFIGQVLSFPMLHSNEHHRVFYCDVGITITIHTSHVVSEIEGSNPTLPFNLKETKCCFLAHS